MASIESFIDEVIRLVRAVSGIQYAPDDPPGQLATHPAAVVWLTGGRVIMGPDTLVEYHYTVRIGLVTSMQNMALANQRILPQIEPVIEAIAGKQRDLASPFVNSINIDEVTFTYGPIEWADVWYFGALIDLGDVKIQRTL